MWRRSGAPLTNEYKRVTLLRMLPPALRKSIWDTASKLYPTFEELLGKVQEMAQDDTDARNGSRPMDLDELGEKEKDWKRIGQTLVGKGPAR